MHLGIEINSLTIQVKFANVIWQVFKSQLKKVPDTYRSIKTSKPIMISIRKLPADQLSKVQSIAQRTWPTTFANILSSEQIEYMLNWMYSLEMLESQLEKGHTFLLAEEEGTDFGFAGFELNYSEGPKAKLHKIYLLPEAQGKGAGKALILEVADRARKASQKSLLLNVNKHNQNAINFYHRIGFQEIYKEVIDIGNGYIMDDVVMELEL